MTVNFSPVSSYTAFKGNSNHTHTCPECGTPIEEAKPEKSTFSKAKDGFIGIRKFFIDCGYMIGGAFKGTFHGAVLGGITAGALAVRNLVKHAPQALGTKGKIIAGAVALGALAVDLVKAKLDANEAKSRLDHRWETGHNA